MFKVVLCFINVQKLIIILKRQNYYFVYMAQKIIIKNCWLRNEVFQTSRRLSNVIISSRWLWCRHKKPYALFWSIALALPRGWQTARALEAPAAHLDRQANSPPPPISVSRDTSLDWFTCLFYGRFVSPLSEPSCYPDFVEDWRHTWTRGKR